MSEKKHIIFDGTILNEVQACAMKTYLGHEINLRPHEMAVPLEEGDLLHKMLEHYYKKVKDFGIDITHDNESFKNCQDECVAVGEAYSVQKNLDASEIEQVIYQFIEYSKHYRMDGIIPKFVEEPFISQLYEDDELTIHYTGKIDLIAEVPNYPGDSIIDHKKSGRNIDPLQLSNQFTGYSWAADIPTVIVNKIGFQKTMTPDQRFRRYPKIYQPFQIKRWVDNTIWWGQQYAFYIENNTWPENRTSCDKYSGCIFQDVCNAASEEAREWIMKTKFIIGEKWDVSAALGAKDE